MDEIKRLSVGSRGAPETESGGLWFLSVSLLCVGMVVLLPSIGGFNPTPVLLSACPAPPQPAHNLCPSIPGSRPSWSRFGTQPLTVVCSAVLSLSPHAAHPLWALLLPPHTPTCHGGILCSLLGHRAGGVSFHCSWGK